MTGSQFYKPEEAIYHNDGREEALLDFIQSHPSYPDMKGNPAQILAAIDQYGREKAFLMNVGEAKGQIVSEVIAHAKPHTIVELGGYVGYSAILFASTLRKAGGQKYISLEASATFARVSSALIELAGLADMVEVIVGPCSESLRALGKVSAGKPLDMLFFDHAKVEYLNDLRLCEELGLVGRGTTVVADNVSRNQVYLDYVRAPTSTKQEEAVKLRGLVDGDDASSSVGNPALKYRTSVVHSIEPTGEPDAVEISHCLGSE
ncbi:hypothetical protein FE257_010312 [Aspergillus nanangensis]|uniref:catechol O-methyltransferase n=1 Tax=Aspergillus nanangensis TaxID=2582783 RepID=A0AAD4CJA4_ASPNN|nr:hypothetical protein FE257_010312 [Aspergillus nanangensis]